VPALTGLVASAHAAGEPALERRVLGTDDPTEVASVIEAFVDRRLGPVADALFYRRSVGIVAGLRLGDGSQVVLKVHHWNAAAPRLAPVHQVQRELAGRGLPAPRPLVGPEPLGRGMATVEELVAGGRPEGPGPVVRRSLARGLSAFVDAAAPLVGRAPVGGPLMLREPGAPLWFEPHDVRFDFGATGTGAEWIDQLATQARRRLEPAGSDLVIGHFDWRVENLGFRGAEIVAIYDWDAVCAAPEPVVVGNAAAQFTADWTSGGADPLPTVDEMRAFVADYESARGRSFSTAERQVLDAANLSACAYGARCAHSDMVLRPEILDGAQPGWIRLLHERGSRALLD
jgi:hypothetical protein